MKKTLSLLLILATLSAWAQDIGDPVADPAAVVVCGNARFTVLGSRLIRMEWAEDGQFEDRATLGVVNRKMPVPPYTTKRSGKGVTIKTGDITLTYSGSGKFSGDNLSVSFSMADPSSKRGAKTVTWHPGLDEGGNLLGTTRTLDGCDGEKTADPYDKGVVSLDGWAVIDESERHVLESVDSDWGKWVAPREPGQRQDLYLFAYGHDYMAAVSDFTKIGGSIPLPPKFAFGYWWCRYWQYSDFEFVRLGRQIRSFGIPIDVMVLDMDWHKTWTMWMKDAPHDEFGQRVGWTGYTWNNTLFPNPANLLKELSDLGLKTTLNLHPASGIQPHEEPYERFLADYLSRTDDYDGPKGYVKEDGSKAPVPFRIDDMAWADAYFNSVIHPLEKLGIDFWWVDWQQWKESKYTPGLSNTFWINYAFFNDMVRQSASEGTHARRPMIYHRWGGIGSHRYQIGFSGDTYATWKVLGYLPHFTATASNVGYGYWGHDIGGHMQPPGATGTDPEMYTRWLQFGVFTPIFKTHSTKDMTMEKRFWVFPDYFDAMRAAIRLRYDLSPYIYNAAREAHDSGVSICRPLYYYWPEAEESYSYDQEYLFGEDILATVICERADSVTALAHRTVWFPEGEWYDMASGSLIEGGQTLELSYTIDENPYYIKAGAVIPLAGAEIRSLQEESNELRLLVVPGDGQSRARIYEDDGKTQAYEEEYAVTTVSKTSDGESLLLIVAPREGHYEGMSENRKLDIILEGILPPTKICVNGQEVPYSRFAAHEEGPVWGYDGSELSATVYLPEAPVGEETRLECTLCPCERSLLDGKKGIIKRMMALTPESKLVLDGKADPESFLQLAQYGSFITENPSMATSLLEAFDPSSAVETLASFGTVPEDFLEKLRAQSR